LQLTSYELRSSKIDSAKGPSFQLFLFTPIIFLIYPKVAINMRNPKVFFDGDCPVCSREIDFYQRRSGAEQIEWVDINSCEDVSLPPCLDRSTLLTRFHVVDRKGEVHEGAAAFIALWRELPSFKAPANLLGSRLVLPVLEKLYVFFLVVRSKLKRNREFKK
jgi:predicted DCC family thiol-disulfide oxidoreductase YuxK